MADHRANVYFDDATNRHVFRASSLARCQQSLIAAALGMEPLPTPQVLQRAFDEGSAGEDEVLRMFAEGPGCDGWHPKSPALEAADPLAVWRLLDPTNLGSYHDGQGNRFPHVDHAILDDDQFTMELPVGGKAVIRGHLDGIVEQFTCSADEQAKLTPNGERAVVEAKLLGPDLFAKLIRHGLVKGFEHYAVQLSLYMTGTGLPGWFVAGEKVRWTHAFTEEWEKASGPQLEHLRFDVASVYVARFDEPPVPLAKIKARVVRLVKAIEVRDLPACDVNQYPCEYSYLHDGTEVELTGEVKPDPVALEGDIATRARDLAAVYSAASKAEGDAKKAKAAAKTALAELLDVGDSGPSSPGGWTAGEWTIAWVHEEVEGGTYTRKPSVRSYPKITEKKVEG